jgi:hypothetical protein
MSNKSVVGIVENTVQADALVRALELKNISPSKVSVIFPDKHGTKDFAHEHNTKAPEGAVAGVGAGGAIGGALGLLAGIGALAIPGVGPLIAAGPLMAALSGAAAGAAVGGITGALIGLGIPELEAKTYEGKIQGGQILFAVHVENGEEEKAAKEAFEQNHATDVSVTRDASVPKPSDSKATV